MKETRGKPEVANGEGGLAARLVRDARAAKWTIATAESCTGGLLGAELTSVPGASACYLGGIVAYANDVKRRQLGVPDEDLNRRGAVSSEVAQAMARGARRALRASMAVAVTGVAGPGGGSSRTPVGTVWIAVSVKEERQMSPILCRFKGGREQIRSKSVEAAIRAMRRALALHAPHEANS